MDKRRTLTETALLLSVSLCLMISQGFVAQQIIYLLAAVFLTGLIFLIRKAARWGLILAVVSLCMLWPPLAFFLPSMLRICPLQNKRVDGSIFIIFSTVLFILPLPQLAHQALLVVMLVVSLYLRHNDQAMTKLSQAFLSSKDNHWEKQQQLAQQNKQLLDSHETQLALQIAEERNRIARDIHDNVGHLLSRALLQIGALETINQDTTLQVPLSQLKETVNTGMNHIRLSVHDLHAGSLSFEEAVQHVLKIEELCPVEIQGNLFEGLSEKQQNCLLMVMKEALTNTIKHSQATFIIFHFKTLPAFYRLQIRNNGVLNQAQQTSGIGLQTMQQRLRLLNGQIHIAQKDRQFQLTIILPKEPT